MQILMTNIIGPKDCSTIDNARVRSLQFWPPAKGEVTGGVAVLSFQEKLQIFSVFDETEFKPIFQLEEEYKSLSPSDRAALSQFVGNMIKAEFLNLDEMVSRQVNTINQIQPTTYRPLSTKSRCLSSHIKS